jgi:hypothetical protein
MLFSLIELSPFPHISGDKHNTAQLKKIVLCLFPEICVKGDSLIRENSIMLISRYV